MTTFTEEVFAVVRMIPRGKTMTYKEVAEAIGRPGAARAVGNTLNTNRDPNIPCHRVVRSDGTSGGYYWGADKKKERLRQEGAL